MTVIARSKTGARANRRRREGRLGRVAERVAAAGGSQRKATTTAQSTVAASRRREGGAPQDQAVYSCSCGFVFEAHVSTSVGCPHCGGTQAW
jgi:predicted Zn-ribbon and HTH transcriptional regulator